jgi:hypothetical protein
VVGATTVEGPLLQRFDAAGGAPSAELLLECGWLASWDGGHLSPRPTPSNEGLRVWIMGLSGLQLLLGHNSHRAPRSENPI